MPNKIFQYLNHQHTPELLHRFPRLWFFYFWLNHLSVLRMKYARRSIRQVLRSAEPPKRIVDAGCGMGDFLFTISEFKNAERITGIDYSQSNIDVCNRLAAMLRRKNMDFVCSDLGTAEIPPGQDLILCIAVLMLIKDDMLVLKRFRDALAPNGKLLLYAAVNYRRKLSIYKYFAKKSGFDYDEIIGRPQTYTDESLEKKLNECGFVIEEKIHSFGIVAATMFELSSIFEWLFKSWHPAVAVIVVPFYLIFLPLYILSMLFDYHGTRTTGNGVMIIAKKQQ